MDLLNEVNAFIQANILQSSVWDSSTELQKTKAVNHSMRTLKRLLMNKYLSNPIPVEDIAEQCIWILKIDDMFQRAELGATYIAIDGMAVNVKEKDRSLCPFIMEKFNLSEGWNSRRKVGRYQTSMQDSFRKGW